MKRSILFLLSVLLACICVSAPSFAATWSSSQLTANRQFDYSFTSTDTTGLSTAADASQCATLVTGWENGTTGTAELYACPYSTSAAAACTQIGALTTNASGTAVMAGLPWLKVNRSALPASGPGAKLYLYCGQQARSGAGTSTYGIVGSTGNDTTLEKLTTMRHAAYLPPYPRIYFSTATTDAACVAALGGSPLGGYPTGNDTTGDGSINRPYRSMGRVLATTRSGRVIAVLDACDTWDTSGLGNDEESASFLLTNISGKSMTWITTDLTKCTDPDALCFAIIGSDPSGRYRPLLAFATLTGASPQSSWFNPSSVTSGQGWIHIENIRSATSAGPYPQNGAGACNTAGDLFRPDGNGKMSILNVDAYMCSPAAQQNEFWTSHWSDGTSPSDTNYTWSINNHIFYPDMTPDGNTVSYLNAGQSSIGVIGGFTYSLNTNTATLVNRTCFVLAPGVSGLGDSNYGFVYGHDCFMLRDAFTSRDGFRCTGMNDTTTECYLSVSRSRVVETGPVFSTNGGFWDIKTGGATWANVTMRGYRNSSIDNASYIYANSGIPAAMTLRIVDRCSLHYKGATGVENAFFDNQNASSFCDGIDFDVIGTGMIQNDIAVMRLDAALFTTISAAQTAYTSCTMSSGVHAAWTNFLPTTLTSNPYGTDGTSGIAQTAEAKNACNVGSFRDDLRNGMYLPAYIAGAKVASFVQNQEGRVVSLGR